MRFLLLSAYDTPSHRHWRERLEQLFADEIWCQLSLPARHFEWRVRSNSLHWGLGEYPELARDWDVLIATSMVDLAALRGLRPKLANIPTLLYFHENQFFYPSNPGHSNKRQSNVEPLLIPVYSALCADRILFNSEFNKQSFLQGARALFERLPDQLPAQAWQKLEASGVLPVPVSTRDFASETREVGEAGETRPSRTANERQSADRKILEVIWNHRWEYDKGPELLLAVARELIKQKASVRLHVVGQQFRRQPDEFAEIELLCRQLAEQQDLPPPCLGFIEDRKDYEALLYSADVALSTAWHEFQGLGIQEACVAGCCPLAPNDLAYPEYLPAECLYERRDNSTATAIGIVERLLHWQGICRQNRPQPSLDDYCGSRIRAQYWQEFERLVPPGS